MSEKRLYPFKPSPRLVGTVEATDKLSVLVTLHQDVNGGEKNMVDIVEVLEGFRLLLSYDEGASIEFLLCVCRVNVCT